MLKRLTASLAPKLLSHCFTGISEMSSCTWTLKIRRFPFFLLDNALESINVLYILGNRFLFLFGLVFGGIEETRKRISDHESRNAYGPQKGDVKINTNRADFRNL